MTKRTTGQRRARELQRTTGQRRARELQRTAGEQGTHLSYHDALTWVRATAEARAEHPDEIVVFAPHAVCIMIFDADEDPEYIRDSITPVPAADGSGGAPGRGDVLQLLVPLVRQCPGRRLNRQALGTPLLVLGGPAGGARRVAARRVAARAFFKEIPTW